MHKLGFEFFLCGQCYQILESKKFRSQLQQYYWLHNTEQLNETTIENFTSSFKT